MILVLLGAATKVFSERVSPFVAAATAEAFGTVRENQLDSALLAPNLGAKRSTSLQPCRDEPTEDGAAALGTGAREQPHAFDFWGHGGRPTWLQKHQTKTEG